VYSVYKDSNGTHHRRPDDDISVACGLHDMKVTYIYDYV